MIHSRLFVVAMWLVLPCAVKAAAPLHQRIDQAIAARAGGSMAGPATDAEFLRRVYLDLAGTIPTAAETRKFLNDKDAGKRTRLIDTLLERPSYARRMQQAVTVWLLERRAGQTISDKEWNEYLQAAFARNQPWDELVRELVSGDGTNEKTRATIRFFLDGGRNDHHQLTQDIARIFLGMNLMCAQCHDHPNVKDYKQAHFFGIYAYLRQSKQHRSKSQKTFYIETVAKDKIEFQSVFKKIKRQTGPRLPDGQEVEIPTFEKGQEFATPAKDGFPGVPKFQPRRLLAGHLTAKDNRRFARNSVNRFWFLMMGRGLVHPLDLMHSKNPASHPELLDALTEEFVKHRFEVKYLLREIALSQAYQRSSVLPSGVKPEDVQPQSYRAAHSKPLSAEQLAFSIMESTGHLGKIQSAPIPKDSKFTHKDYINRRIPVPGNLPDVLKLFAATFGNPPGEPEVEFGPSASQSLFLTNDRLIQTWTVADGNNLVVRLAKLPSAEAIAEELYLSVLTRMPAQAEVAEVKSYLASQESRRAQAMGDLVWALLTSSEFRLNH